MINMRNNIYLFLFFSIGFCWVLPFQARNICSTLLVIFYCVDCVIFKQDCVDKLFIIFLAFLLTTMGHLAAMCLYEMVRFSYVPFHDIYLSFGMRNVFKLIQSVAWIYVTINVLREYAHSGSLIRICASGHNTFIVMLF